MQQQEEVRRIEPAHPNWEKAQKYCRMENMLENTWLLELRWMIGEVIVIYIECR